MFVNYVSIKSCELKNQCLFELLHRRIVGFRFNCSWAFNARWEVLLFPGSQFSVHEFLWWVQGCAFNCEKLTLSRHKWAREKLLLMMLRAKWWRGRAWKCCKWELTYSRNKSGRKCWLETNRKKVPNSEKLAPSSKIINGENRREKNFYDFNKSKRREKYQKE